MRDFLDTSVIVPALLARHPQHRECHALIPSGFSDAHCMAEAFAVLTAAFRIANYKAAELLTSLPRSFWCEIRLEDYRQAVNQSRKRGVHGGGIYDAIHATVARRQKAKALLTYNVTNFQHCGADLNVRIPESVDS